MEIRNLSLFVAGIVSIAPMGFADELSDAQQLGKALFFDTDLSFDRNMSCASCHDPNHGFGSPVEGVHGGGSVVEGSIPGRFGNRKPPTAAYAANAPVFHHTIEDGGVLFVGGAFLDGRATGHILGTAAADQAMGPFTNPVEMAMPHAACVVQRACEAAYSTSLGTHLGTDICSIDFPTDLAASCAHVDAEITIEDDTVRDAIDAVYFSIARAIAAYENSPEMSRYSSRFDKWQSGDAPLTAQELAGFKLFSDKALCSECHVLDRGPHNEPALFTDYTYDNLGVPRNPALPFYQTAGTDWIDPGLAGFLATDPIYDILAAGAMGKQKVPTLRNVDARPTPDAAKAYMHNGYFKTLEGVVRFYNTRDVWPACENDLVTEADALAAKCWPAPEVAANVNADELGNLKLTAQEEADLVAFLKALTDEK